MESHHSPSTLLQLCPTFLGGTAKQQKGSKAQDRYRRQGRGHWGQPKDLGVAHWDLGRHRVSWSWWGTWSSVQGSWETMAAMAPAGLSPSNPGDISVTAAHSRAVCVRQPWMHRDLSSLCTVSGSRATGWSPLFWPTQMQAGGCSASLPTWLINWCDFLITNLPSRGLILPQVQEEALQRGSLGVEHHLWQDCKQSPCPSWRVTAIHAEPPKSSGT